VNQPNQGVFIVVEGIDGSGSTTQSKRLVSELNHRRRRAEFTCEPTTGPIGVMLRQILAKRLVVPTETGSRAPDWRTMALLFAADRADHNDVFIEPKLQSGCDVVTDRYVLSSLAYQSLTSPGGTQNLTWLRQINDQARVPDLTIVLTVSADVAAQRRAGRGGSAELYEVDVLQRRLAEFYVDAAEMLGSPVTLVDANADQETVALAVWAAAFALTGAT
jgi:dTMP kinase